MREDDRARSQDLEASRKRGQAARSAREARDAELSVRMHRAKLRLQGEKTVELWAVAAVELKKPKDSERVLWNLLTARVLEPPEDAVKCVGDYARRWGIEEFHRVLKDGCKVEHLALRELDHVQRAIGIEEIVAWSFMIKHKLDREHPELPPDVPFDDLEVAVLNVFNLKKSRKLASLGETDRLGGHARGLLCARVRRRARIRNLHEGFRGAFGHRRIFEKSPCLEGLWPHQAR
ncbi:MAG: hypothetical protein K6C33_09365 [Desulfovibrio sp.]|nr:hypothetical protein [Desulfovibrio sp.]